MQLCDLGIAEWWCQCEQFGNPFLVRHVVIGSPWLLDTAPSPL
jgi:hypothetical protein